MGHVPWTALLQAPTEAVVPGAHQALSMMMPLGHAWKQTTSYRSPGCRKVGWEMRIESHATHVP